MTPEKDLELVRNFPLLYRDRRSSPKRSLMCFGFACDDGWYDLIWDLSSKLEELIIEWTSQNQANCTCGEPAWLHVDGTGRCTQEYDIPHKIKIVENVGPMWRKSRKNKIDHLSRVGSKKFLTAGAQYYWWRFRHRVQYRINRFLSDTVAERWGIWKETVPSKCEKFQLDYPCAMQVEEKFGGLRFYITHGTDEMYELISKAEEKSCTICERCGSNEGTTSGNRGYWIQCLCSDCREENDRFLKQQREEYKKRHEERLRAETEK